ncbi:MAG: AI-2E family transporter [Bacteroidetes bacterium]|nr:AI-2E family transporter [Bacteroidota bacterium]MBP7400881.1 AI-2E family transporter [Chitinophagales bacterium]MBK7107627.1 AI-2E family transporter [Bacteroidota bacterium]MBK8486966.1 AI-2E family transporter [Bacteroidota bacterium]MBK8680335.1 AI-2E family transporter [Bacteroidota bacterium]
MPLSITALKQRNILILIIIIFIGIFIALELVGILGGLLGAIIIYVIFRPLNIYLQEKRKWNKGLSTALILFLSFVCIIIPIFFLIKLISNRVIFYINNPEITEEILKNIDRFATEKLNEPDLINETITNLKAGAAALFGSIVNGAANTFVQILVMYFTLYFTMKNFRQFENGLVHYLPFIKSNSVRIGNELRNMTYSNILGQGLIAIIQGTLLGIGFLIFGIPEPVFWGVIGTFLSMIPMFGAPLIFIPAGLIELSNGNSIAGIGIIVYGYLIVTTIDNFIRMAIGRKIANTHPLITIIGVVIGIPLFGILGILYGPLMLSLFIILINIYTSNKVEIEKLEGDENNL